MTRSQAAWFQFGMYLIAIVVGLAVYAYLPAPMEAKVGAGALAASAIAGLKKYIERPAP